jgi:hypothetical protein
MIAGLLPTPLQDLYIAVDEIGQARHGLDNRSMSSPAYEASALLEYLLERPVRVNNLFRERKAEQ